MVMIFKSKKALKFLLVHGYVYTFRSKKRKKVGKDWMNDGRGNKKIADIEVSWEGRHTVYDLKEFVKDSGFDTLEEWWNEIKILNKGFAPYYGHVYFVKLVT